MFRSLLSLQSTQTVTLALHKVGPLRSLATTSTANTQFGFGITLDRASPQSLTDTSERKLAVVCGWMGAKPKQLKPYKQFYADRGYDVLSYAVGPEHVLQPQTSMDLVQTVLDETLRPSNGDPTPDKVVTHCFSVGGYLTGQLLRVLNDPARRDDKLQYHRLVRAQVYDSPPDFNGIARGIGKSMAMGQFVADRVEEWVRLYLWAVRDTAGKEHRASSAQFHDNHLLAPSLWLYSEADPVAVPEDIQTVMAKWAAKGSIVEQIVWKDTPHIQHARYDPERYFGGLNGFLQKHV
jgi:Eukaryotic protein of unknown function (DUF829)